MAMRQFERFNFESLNEFNGIVGKMAQAEYKSVYVQDHPQISLYEMATAQENGYDIWSRDYTAIINKKAGNIAQIASSQYKILQSPLFFATVSDLLEQQGFRNIHGYVDEIKHGEIYNARMIFGDVTLDEPGIGQNIDVGASFTNSYNATGANGSAYYLRLICTNGMTMKHLIPDCDFSKSHMAVSETTLLELVTVKIEKFIKQMIDSDPRFQVIMKNAMDTEIEFQKEEQLYEALEGIFKTKVHSKAIHDIAMKDATQLASDRFVIDTWTLYNAVTNYSSHNPMTPNVQDTILLKAENYILKKPLEIPAIA